MAKVDYDGAPRAALASTPVGSDGPPAASVHPWDCEHPEWAELYRYFPFLQTDADGNPITADTLEPPRTAPDPETGKVTTKTYMPPEKFDVAKHGATHYTVTPPAHAEVVFQCKSCVHAEPVPVPAAITAKLAADYEAGQLTLQHFSQLTLKELLGTELTPSPAKIEKPPVPEWADEQRAMIRRLGAGLPAVEETA